MANEPSATKTSFPHNKTPQEWIELLTVRQPAQRRQAALGAGQLGTTIRRRSAGGATRVLDDKTELVRRQAAESLGRQGSRARPAVGKLCEALADAKEFIRQQAAEALGRIGPAAHKAVPALTQALSDPVKYVRWQTAVALGRDRPRTRPRRCRRCWNACKTRRRTCRRRRPGR